MKPEQERIKQVIAESVTLMCRNGINFQKEIRIEAVIGITIDSNDVLLVHINERVPVDSSSKTAAGAPSQHDGVSNVATDPACIIGDITQKVFTKITTAAPAKETPTPRGKNNGTTKGPAKRAPAKRVRKQKLIPLTNGQISEKVVSEGVGVVGQPAEKSQLDGEMAAGQDSDNYRFRGNIQIKSEPPDVVAGLSLESMTQNGIVVDAEGSNKSKGLGDNNLNIAKSDDDALAMQQSYVSPLSMEPNITEQLPVDKTYSPPLKRKLLSADSDTAVSAEFIPGSGLGMTISGKGEDDSELSQRVNSLSPSWPLTASTMMTDDGFSSPVDMKPSVGGGTSTWCSPTQSKSRSRRPSNGLQSTAVKRMLSEYLVEPIAQTDCKVCTFRLMWHGSVAESEQVWSQLSYYQDAIDRIITEPAQVALAVSAVTATSTRPKSGTVKLEAANTTNGTTTLATTTANMPDKFRTFPGLAYWIVLQNETDFTETDLYNRIYENCFGARLKSLSDQAVASDLQEMCSTLYLVVKDNVDGYVRWKLDAVLPTSADGDVNFQPVVKVYARAEQDFNTLLMAREALQKNRFYFSLLKTDV